MANTILHKRSAVAAAIPAGSSLTLGELAVNTTDGKLYTKKGDGTIVQIGAASSGSTRGTALLDFGSFPGASDASLAVTGQTSVTSGTVVKCWLYPVATSDHTADEHLVETLDVFVGNIVAGTGFTIYGVNESAINEPTGKGTRIYGKWTVAWEY